MSEDYFHHRNSAHRYEIQKVDDEGDIQLIDANGMTDEEHTNIMRVYPHGFTSHSPKNSHMVALGLGGRRDNIVAIGGEHQDYRIKKLKEGEAVVYDMKGNVVFMHLGDGIAVNAKVGTVAITAQEKSIDLVSKTDTTIKAEGKVTSASKGDTKINADAKLTVVGKGVAAFGSSGDITFIGGDGTDGDYQFVVTVAGISTKVKAKM
jgi:phage gp45-like